MKKTNGKINLSKHGIMEVQSALLEEGYYNGKIDGRFGQETRKAIRSYQKEHKLKITGEPTVETLEKLGVSFETGGSKRMHHKYQDDDERVGHMY